MRTLFTIFLYLLLGATTVCAQQKAFRFIDWEFVEPQQYVAQSMVKRPAAPRPELPTTMEITDSIPVLPIGGVVWFGLNFERFDCCPEASSDRVYISRKTGKTLVYSRYGNNYTVQRATDKEREEQRKVFATLPTDSLFAIETYGFGYVWGCVDNGTVRLYARTPRRDDLLESDLLPYATLGEVICQQYGSFSAFEKRLTKWAHQGLAENIFFNRFATATEAEEFLRANYSFYATAYPDDHAEIVRRFVALLDKQLTLTRAERKFLERKSKEIASVAGVFDPTLRRAEFKRLLSLSFSKERLRSAVVALMVDDESLRRAEQRYIYDTYSGCYKEHYTHQKAAAIYLIYGKKVPIPQYPTPTLVSASEELCGY